MGSFNTRTKKMILLANLTAFAIVLGIMESWIDILAVPGAKLGLANLVSLVILYMFGFKEAFIVTILRVLLVGLLSGVLGPPFWMGLAGGTFSICMMAILKNLKLSTTVVSLFGSISHQVGQMTVGVFILGSSKILLYLYIMLPLGIVAGIVIGLIAEKFLIHYNKRVHKEEE